MCTEYKQRVKKCNPTAARQVKPYCVQYNLQKTIWAFQLRLKCMDLIILHNIKQVEFIS